MRSQTNFRLTCWIMIGALLAAAILSLHSVTGQERGQGVKIKVETGQEIDLYDESHALVIGVSDYNNGWRKLPGVVADVAQVSAVLERQGFRVVKLMNPARAEFDGAIQRFISQCGLKERNRLVIYFAGHGYTERLSDDRDLGYIVMRNAPKPEQDPQQFSLCAISMDEINAYALRIKSKHALFVFDSCFAGSIFRGEGDNRPPPQIESKTAGPVRQFITSGTAGQEAPDDSIFRRYFVRAFDERLGDLNGDGYITGEELGIYLSGRVAGDSRDTQTPRYGKIRDAKLNIGDFVFALKSWPPLARVGGNKPLVTMSFTTAKVDARGNVTKQPGRTAQGYVEELPGGVRLEMVEVRGGSFLMGTSAAEAPAVVKELMRYNTYQETAESMTNMTRPQHRVVVSDFYLGRYEVTQGQWKAVMGGLPPRMDNVGGEFKGDFLPVVRVSWSKAKEFIEKLNKLTGGDYRLPSEAEWEYAARAGSQEAVSFGPTITPEVANYNGGSPYGQAEKGKFEEHPVRVGSYPANAFGLFDMHGNVLEWCEDIWHGSYNGAPIDGRAWESVSAKVFVRASRGGSWLDGASYCRSAHRHPVPRGFDYLNLGFRLVRTAS